MRQVQTPVHHFCSRTERDGNILSHILSHRALRAAAENAETTDVTELEQEGLGGTGLCPLASGNRVGLRLRVEIVNLPAIAVFDDSAAQLQGGGEGSVVGGEFVGDQHDSF